MEDMAVHASFSRLNFMHTSSTSSYEVGPCQKWPREIALKPSAFSMCLPELRKRADAFPNFPILFTHLLPPLAPGISLADRQTNAKVNVAICGALIKQRGGGKSLRPMLHPAITRRCISAPLQRAIGFASGRARCMALSYSGLFTAPLAAVGPEIEMHSTLRSIRICQKEPLKLRTLKPIRASRSDNRPIYQLTDPTFLDCCPRVRVRNNVAYHIPLRSKLPTFTGPDNDVAVRRLL